MTLTDRTLRNAKPRKSVYRMRDGNSLAKGFVVAVAPAGSNTFFLGYYTSPTTGKRIQVNLGRYPATSLKDARGKAQAYRDELAIGIDLKETMKKVRKADVDLANRPTMSAAAPGRAKAII